MKHLLGKIKKPDLMLLLLLCLGISSSAIAQEGFTVTGNIADEFNVPLPGASIIEKGTTNGVSTDFDGNFSIEVANQNSTLVITYIGYAEQEIPINGQSQISTSMEPSASTLDEIVLVGYGAVKKKDLTGAISQIDAAAVSHQSTNSVTDVLRSNMAGVSIGFSTSPKGVSNIQIRGNNSLSAGSSPLIVVDGMIYNGDLSDISPSDIAKLDVMKDASSAAVYGARGASGVILITTKRGTSEKPTITINSSVGVVTDGSNERPYSADGYVNWRSDVFKSINPQNTIDNPGRYDDPNNLPSGVTLDQWLAYDGSAGDPTRAWLNRLGFQDVEIGNYLEGNSIDWYDRINQTGLRTDWNTSISGRKEGLNYYWSIGRTSNEGITSGEKFETLRSRLNLDAKITDFLTVGINTQFAKRDEGFIPANRGQIERSSPWGSEFDDDGNIRLSPQDDSGAGASNAFLGQMFNDRIDLDHTFNSRVYAKVKLPLGFSYELGYTNRLEFREYYNHASAASPANVVGSATRQALKINEWQLDNILRWDKTIDKHTFNLMFLVYAEKYQDRFTRARANTFEPSDALGFGSLEAGAVQTVDSEDIKSTGDAFMTRLNYNYDSRYLLTLTMRRDGYSAFGANNKRAYFPSIAGAWTISNENFFKSNFIDFLKLRLSYGENGNRDIGRFAYLSRLNAGKYLNVDSSGNVITVPTFDNTTQENVDLRWERTKAVNLGLDFSLANGIVEGSFEAYRNITDDLIVTRQLPNIIGFNSVTTNLGEIENSGFEFTLSTQNYNLENFKWNSSFNFSLNRNKINELYGDMDENGNELDDVTNRRFIGEATDVIWGKEILGVWQEDEAADAADWGVFPGDFKLRDVNNDGVYTDEDNIFQGHRSPRFRWGLTNLFTLKKNIDFSFELYSHWGQKRVFNEAKNRNGFIDRTNSIQTPYWTSDNPTNDYARLFSSDGSASFNVYRESSFIRLSNVTLAYRFPKPILEKLSIQSLRVYANARNLAVWAPHWDLYDPEAQEFGAFDSRRPSAQFFTFGIDLSL
ncbi:SusC/RagA family TonB-linked outer membrane protein [Maribacter sp. HTCC2170]|uniref:SusC/RagA family TonB-linked outer membrane protein n=1 Tax=Maribacter sp. (strain HTCC2170 / KCCM 42371) TaxID=313603 RepID=UPI00006B49A7|nr:SusC/RagA family TonB-linked outer membrane protein [Maribacter sp. HTCC2170]EAR00904.1 putative outer membrane protein, probably involved in nutrient binding [Maribacter sp. HTCC2170]